MKTRSCKAKGRVACQRLQASLLASFPELTADDIRVTPSGVNGPDLQLSSRAKTLLPYSFEVKNQERLNISAALRQCHSNANEAEKGVLAFTKNREAMYVAMDLELFSRLARDFAR